MARTTQTRNWELGVFAALAAVVIVPTALVMMFSIRALTRAKGTS